MQDIKNYNGTKFFIIGHCLTTRCRLGSNCCNASFTEEEKI